MARTSHPERLDELDALRGIAAVMVLLFHLTWQAPNVVPGLQTVPYGFSWGSYGVELFFAISGFVIFMTLERTRRSVDFVVSRFARLFPAYWAGIALTTLTLALLGPASLAQPPGVVAINLTMLQSFLYLPSVDGVYWSLAVELAFYACMWGLWRARLLGRIEQVLLVWIALKALWWLAPALPSRLGLLLVTQYIPYFAVGIAAYRVWAGQRSWRDQGLVLACGLAVVTLTGSAAAAMVYLANCAIFVALVQRRLAWLRHPVLLWLGALSYPIYLVHQFVGYSAMSVIVRNGGSVWLATGIALVIAFGAAQAIHVFIEKPSLGSIRGWWRDRSARLSPIG